GGDEVLRQVLVVDQGAVPGEGRIGDRLHHLAEAVEGLRRRARRGVQGRALEHRGQREFQVYPGRRWQHGLVGDDVALLGELDLALEHAVRLAQDRVVGGAAAAADGAAATVEQAQGHAVTGRRIAQRTLRLVDLPLAGD